MSEPTMQEARRAVLQAIADNVNDIIATHGGTARAVVQTLDSETLDAYAAAVRRETLNEVRAMVADVAEEPVDAVLNGLTQLEARDGTTP